MRRDRVNAYASLEWGALPKETRAPTHPNSDGGLQLTAEGGELAVAVVRPL